MDLKSLVAEGILTPKSSNRTQLSVSNLHLLM